MTENNRDPYDSLETQWEAQYDQLRTPERTVIGNYELIESLGKGGMGEVWLARHKEFHNRLYAVKLIRDGNTDRDAIDRFKREIKVTGSLSHENLVHAHDAGVVGNSWYLVMEYVPGCDLQHYLDSVGRLTPAQAASVLMQAAYGLSHAHAHQPQIIHRDIKPSNLLINVDGLVKVADLGLASFQGGAISQKLTRYATTLGTPHYMAPEVWGDAGNASIASDIYALGCTLYAAITGDTPFGKRQGGLPALMNAHVAEVPRWVNEIVPETPEPIVRLVAQSLEKQPALRIASANEFAELLRPFAQLLPGNTIRRLVAKPSALGGDRLPSTRPSISSIEDTNHVGEDVHAKVDVKRAEQVDQSDADRWTINQQPAPILRRITIVLLALMSLSTFGLVMAYYGPDATETWSRRFDLMDDSRVPIGTGFVVEWLRALLFLACTTLVLAFRFTNEVRRFWDFRKWSIKILANRIAVFAIVGFFINTEITRHLSLDAAPSELVQWAVDHGIDTDASRERGPYKWYLIYSVVNYFVVFGGLLTFPLIRFTMSDFSYVIRRLKDLRRRLDLASSADTVNRVLMNFASECRVLARRYIDLLAILVLGIHYDWWIGWRTLSESGQGVLLLGWIATALAIGFFGVIAGLYTSAYNMSCDKIVTFGSISAEQELSALNTFWFLKKNLFDTFSGLLFLSVVLVFLEALVRR